MRDGRVVVRRRRRKLRRGDRKAIADGLVVSVRNCSWVLGIGCFVGVNGSFS